MNLNPKIVKQVIENILDEDGISVDEMANLSGVSKATIYRIMSETAGFVQRAVVRRIAEGTGRTFKITGDRVEFFRKEAPEPAVDQTDPRMQKIIALLDNATDEELDEIGNFLETAWKLIRIGREKRDELSDKQKN